MDLSIPPRAVEQLRLAELRDAPRNPRTHSHKQIREIARSIERFGFTNPLLIDDQARIVCGHGRAAAARLLGMTAVPVLRLSHLSDAEKRAYVIADNRLAEKAGWDREILAIELAALVELDFEVELTGFETGEIDLMIADAGGAASQADDDVPALEQTVISRPGDLWALGPHRLFCGSALDQDAYAAVLETALAQVVVTDPPYNVRITGHVCGSGRIRHREFIEASGELSSEAFAGFLATAFHQVAARCVEGALVYCFMDWRHLGEVHSAGQQAFSGLQNLIVWNKTNGGMGSLYRSKHELVFLWKARPGCHINNIELGRFGRNRSNVWDYPGSNTFGPNRNNELALHPTVKPVAMIADAILDASRRNGIVLDPFCGSGTVLVAAERTGRRASAIELDPGYVDVAIRRWQIETGRDAVLVASGARFETVRDHRQSASVIGGA